MKKSLYAAAGKIFLMSAMITMMSSCSIYRKYHRPEDLPTDSLYRADLVDTTGFSTAEEDTTSLGYLPWEEVFTDPDLQILIRQGLEHNTDLQAAILSVEQARAQLMASRWAYVPSINLAPQGGLSSIDGGKATWTYNVNGSVSWDVDLFGSLLNSKRGAQATLLQQEAYRQAIRDWQDNLVKAGERRSQIRLAMTEATAPELLRMSLECISAMAGDDMLTKHYDRNRGRFE